MIFLTGLRRRDDQGADAAFPLSLPLIRDLGELRFTSAVTFLVGENGSGKSTLLEGIAMGMQANAVGGHDLTRDPTLEPARRLAKAFLFERRLHARVRIFLRAEDVFGFTQRVERTMTELRAEEAEVAANVRGDYGRRLATGVVAGQRLALARSYGADPDSKSHGETFLALLRLKLVAKGLYLLDEPETPLSPSRVLGLIALMAEAVRQGSQFIIATHSPILMAFPGAQILLAQDGHLRAAAWDDLDHVRVTRAFLADPAAALRKLLG